MKPIKFTWQAGSVNAIALVQTHGAAGSMILNGALVVGGSVSLLPFNQSRYISLQSASDNSAVNFTVTGTYFGKKVSQAIAGPAGTNPVYTTQLFDTVTSITFDAAITAVSAGIGGGRTSWVLYNYNSIAASFTVDVIITASTTLTASFTATSFPFSELQIADANGYYHQNFVGLDAITASTIQTVAATSTGGGNPPVAFSCGCMFVANGSAAAGEFPLAYFTFIQQGIR